MLELERGNCSLSEFEDLIIFKHFFCCDPPAPGPLVLAPTSSKSPGNQTSQRGGYYTAGGCGEPRSGSAHGLGPPLPLRLCPRLSAARWADRQRRLAELDRIRRAVEAEYSRVTHDYFETPRPTRQVFW